MSNKISPEFFTCRFCPVTFISRELFFLHKKQNHQNEFQKIIDTFENNLKKTNGNTFGTVKIEQDAENKNKGELKSSKYTPLTVWLSPQIKSETTEDLFDVVMPEDTLAFTQFENGYDAETDAQVEIDPLDLNNYGSGNTNTSIHTQHNDTCKTLSGTEECIPVSSQALFPFKVQNHDYDSISPYQCGFCKLIFQKKSYLADHERIHTGEKPFVCEKCNMSFRWKMTWRRHCSRPKCKSNKKLKPRTGTTKPTKLSKLTDVAIQSSDRNKGIKQNQNLSQMPNQKQKQDHKKSRITLESKPHKSIKREFFIKYDHIRRQIANGTILNICEFCGKRTTLLCNMKAHVRSHTGERPYTCPFCNAKFATNMALINHKRLHTGERPFKCDECGKEFVASNALYQHKKNNRCFPSKTSFSDSSTTTTTTPTSLPIAANTTIEKLVPKTPSKQQQQLSIKHAVRKIKAKHYPFISRGIVDGIVVNTCKICKRKFNTLSSMKLHLRTHTGEKPYSCSFCNSKFALKNSCQIHERHHTGERPCKCHQCGEFFISHTAVYHHRNGNKCTGNSDKGNILAKQNLQFQREIPPISKGIKSRARSARSVHPHITRKIIDGNVVNFCNFCNRQFDRYYYAKCHALTHLI